MDEGSRAAAAGQTTGPSPRLRVEELPVPTYVAARDGATLVLQTTPVLDRLLGYQGYDPDLLLKVVHPDDRAALFAEIDRSLEAGEASGCEFRTVARDGTVQRWRDLASVNDGRRTGVLVHADESPADTRLDALEAALAHQSQYSDALVRIMPLAIAIIDADGTVTSWNPAAEELFGYSSQEAVGQCIDELIAADAAVRAEGDELTTRVAGGEAVNLTTRRQRRDGGVIDVELLAVPLIVEEQILGAFAIYRDLSEIQRQKRYFEMLVEISPTAVVIFDTEGIVTTWNPAAQRLFGYTSQEAVGHHVDDLVANDPAVRRDAEQYTTSAALGLDLPAAVVQRTRKDGSLVDVAIVGAAVMDGDQQVGTYGLYHDVTELQEARRQADAATHAKSAFLATMSHEIRTPMNAVIGMTGLLLDTELSPEQRGLAEVIRSSGDALLAIINDILDFSKIEAGRLDLEQRPFELAACIESALDMVAPTAATKGINLAFVVGDRSPGAIVGDSTRLRQIVLNLVSNAVKFTDEGEVVVELRAEDLGAAGHGDDRRHRIEILVRDTGIGIPPDRVDSLFDSFSQVDASTTRRYGGTGLGLAISKRLAELMAGDITVDSVPGTGSTFRLTIEADEAPAPLHDYQRHDVPQLEGRRVLVVDDNATNRFILERQTSMWGMRPRLTASATEALAWIERGDPFDVAVLDMQMPELDGVALARAIRQHRDGRALPIIMLTSLGTRETYDDDVDFAAHLTKPIRASELFNVMGRVVGDGPAPAASQPPGTSPAGDVPLATELPLRILIAEDNLVNQQVATLMLAKLGYTADVVANGAEAIAAIERERYDAVLMDVEMPVMDGLEATRRIHARWSREQRPRIIAATANAMHEERDTCIEAGMDDYLVKPLRMTDLVAALRRCTPVPDDVIDHVVLDRLREALADDALVAELTSTFAAQAPTMVDELFDAVERQDHAETRRLAHSLKANARTFGATALAQSCQTLEEMGRAGDLGGARDLVAVVAGQTQAALDALSAKPTQAAP